MAQPVIFPSQAAQEGIVVWDQRGVVVRWSNGEASCFSWETLRHISLCESCREQKSRPDETVAQRHTPFTHASAL